MLSFGSHNPARFDKGLRQGNRLLIFFGVLETLGADFIRPL